MKMSQRIGVGFYNIIQKNNISVEEAARKIGYSIRDLNRFIEGRLFLAPNEIERIANIFSTTPDELISYKPDSSCLLPRLEYNKEFSSEDHLFQIVDLLDEYIELKEQM